jgi:hypothetical protein
MTSATLEEMRVAREKRDAFEAYGAEISAAYIEAERAAEREAEERPFKLRMQRRADYELEFAAELGDQVEARGGAYETTHDVARTLSAVNFRFGFQVDHEAVADVLSRDPEPVGDDYRPIPTAQRATTGEGA